MEARPAGLSLGRFLEQGGVVQGHRGRRGGLVRSQLGADTGCLQAGLCLGAVVVRRIISQYALIQAECRVLMATVVGGPRLPVEHLGEQRRAREMLLKALPEGGRWLVVTLTILQPSS